MDQEKFDFFYNSQYLPKLKHFRRRAYWNQQAARLMNPIIIISSWAATLLLAVLSLADNQVLILGSYQIPSLPIRIIALVCSSISTLISTFIAKGHYEEKWADYGKKYNDLETQHNLYMAGGEEYRTVESEEERRRIFVERCTAIWGQSGPRPKTISAKAL